MDQRVVKLPSSAFAGLSLPDVLELATQSNRSSVPGMATTLVGKRHSLRRDWWPSLHNNKLCRWPNRRAAKAGRGKICCYHRVGSTGGRRCFHIITDGTGRRLPELRLPENYPAVYRYVAGRGRCHPRYEANRKRLPIAYCDAVGNQRISATIFGGDKEPVIHCAQRNISVTGIKFLCRFPSFPPRGGWQSAGLHHHCPRKHIGY